MALRYETHLVRNANGSGRCQVVETECGKVIEECGPKPMPEVSHPYRNVACRECVAARLHQDHMREMRAKLRGDS